MAWNKIGLCLVLLGGVLLYGALSFGLQIGRAHV